jgi:hypothetical protein
MARETKYGAEYKKRPGEHLKLILKSMNSPDRLVWTQKLYSPPQMSYWTSSGAVRGGGKSRKPPERPWAIYFPKWQSKNG